MDEFLIQLNASAIRYLLIGGQAMRLTGMPRYSMDWDFFIPPRDPVNFTRLNDLLGEELGEPILPMGEHGENFLQTFQTRWGVLQFHLGVPGLPKFDLAEAASLNRLTESGTPVKCVSGLHLLASKQAAARPQDQLDIQFLLELQRAGRL